MPPEEKSPLESLEERLYRAQNPNAVNVPAYSGHEQPQAYGWKPPAPPPPPKKRMPWTVKFLIGTGIFLVIAALVAGFLIFRGTRAISTDRVAVDVQGPPSIASGDVASFVITVHNTNPATMQGATMYATLPDGTKAGDGSDAPLTQYSDSLGDVPPGGESTRTLNVKLFGNQNQQVSIPVRVEYHTQGSNAVFVAQKSFTFTISSSPISVQVDTLSQTPSGQSFTINVHVRSNANATVSTVALVAQYPSGFSVGTATPSPSNNLFALGDLAPGQEKVVTITGTLVGDNAAQKVFTFNVGSANPDGTSTLGNSFASSQATIVLTHPFLNVALALNQQSSDTIIGTPGQTIPSELTWQNTLQSTLTNASIQIKLSGNALDTTGISGGTGFYSSSNGSVTFDGTTNSALAALAAGDSGAGSFSFKVKPSSALTNVRNPSITLNVSVSGIQPVQGSQARTLNATITRTVKIGTTVALTSSLSRTASFTNSGPVPPVAGTETTYSLVLTAKNSVNSVGGAKVTMTLPSYVRYTGQAAPSSAISYDADNRIITWDVGDLAPNGTGTVTVQLGFLPSTSQNGTSPIVVGEQSFTGVDRFTGTQVTAQAPQLTSQLPGNANTSSGRVH